MYCLSHLSVISSTLFLALDTLAVHVPSQSRLAQPITETEDWNLTSHPHPEFTGHLIFDTVGALLQHWPNTRYRNSKNHAYGY